MNNITSKLTLYDTFGMIVPGFVILWWWCPAEQCCFQLVNDNWPWVIILSYLIGLIYHRIIECFMHASGMRRNECMLKKTRKKIWEKWEKENKVEDKSSNIQKMYDITYTKLAKHNCLFSIPVIEAQEVFLRNSILLILGSMIKLCYEKVDCLYIVLLLVLFLLAIIFWIQSLHKIYMLVWDSEMCLDKINEE